MSHSQCGKGHRYDPRNIRQAEKLETIEIFELEILMSILHIGQEKKATANTNLNNRPPTIFVMLSQRVKNIPFLLHLSAVLGPKQTSLVYTAICF